MEDLPLVAEIAVLASSGCRWARRFNLDLLLAIQDLEAVTLAELKMVRWHAFIPYQLVGRAARDSGSH